MKCKAIYCANYLQTIDNCYTTSLRLTCTKRVTAGPAHEVLLQSQ